jgi:hypothetical protein
MGAQDRDEQIGGKAWFARAMRDFRQRLGAKEPEPQPEPKPSAFDRSLEVHFLDADGHEVDPAVVQTGVAKVRDALLGLKEGSESRPASSRSIKSPVGAARVRAYLSGPPEITPAAFAFKAGDMDLKTLRRITNEDEEDASRSTWERVANAMGISVTELLP